MAIILARPPISSITSSGESHRMALSIAFQVLKIFVLDCKSFVARAVRRSIARQIAAPLPLRDHGNSRQQALTSWMNEEYALSWAEGTSTTPTTYRYLLTLLAEDPTQPKGGLVKSSEKWNYTRIAQHMVEHGVNGFAPVVKNGYFHTALALASVEIKKYAPNPAQADQWLISVLANTMQKEKIHFVPWHPASERRGTTKRLAVHTHWLFLDHRSTQSPHATSQTIDNPSPRATLTRIAVQDFLTLVLRGRSQLQCKTWAFFGTRQLSLLTGTSPTRHFRRLGLPQQNMFLKRMSLSGIHTMETTGDTIWGLSCQS